MTGTTQRSVAQRSAGRRALGAVLAYRPPQKFLPALATIVVFLAMFGVGSIHFQGFASWQVFLNLFVDNAFLLVVAVGMTFVIISGGIDLSVGSVVGLSTMVSAFLIEKQHWPAVPVMLVVLLIGATLGFLMGYVIHVFDIQPFIATLAGMFFARGLCYVISTDSISINNDTINWFAQTQVPLGGSLHVSPSVVIALIVVAAGIYVLHHTRFGRSVYAVGGGEQSALLMGLAVSRTKIGVYTLSGFCAAVGGLLFTFYTGSGYDLTAVGMELDAIAAVVIGGTLLTGGAGYVVGTVFGVLIYGLIQTFINFDGTLSSWWTRIFIGTLLLIFILLQRLITSGRLRRRRPAIPEPAAAAAPVPG